MEIEGFDKAGNKVIGKPVDAIISAEGIFMVLETPDGDKSVEIPEGWELKNGYWVNDKFGVSARLRGDN